MQAGRRYLQNTYQTQACTVTQSTQNNNKNLGSFLNSTCCASRPGPLLPLSSDTNVTVDKYYMYLLLLWKGVGSLNGDSDTLV